MINGVPVSPAARAALELTTMAGVESSLVSINWLLARSATTKGELESLVVAFRHWPGACAAIWSFDCPTRDVPGPAKRARATSSGESTCLPQSPSSRSTTTDS